MYLSTLFAVFSFVFELAAAALSAVLYVSFFAIFRYFPMSYISLAFKQNNIRMIEFETEAASGEREAALAAIEQQ